MFLGVNFSSKIPKIGTLIFERPLVWFNSPHSRPASHAGDCHMHRWCSTHTGGAATKAAAWARALSSGVQPVDENFTSTSMSGSASGAPVALTRINLIVSQSDPALWTQQTAAREPCGHKALHRSAQPPCRRQASAQTAEAVSSHGNVRGNQPQLNNTERMAHAFGPVNGGLLLQVNTIICKQHAWRCCMRSGRRPS